MATKKSTEKADAVQAADTPEIVTPPEHAAAAAGVEPDESVASPGVPDDVEIAARSADMETPSTEHRKVFVLGPNPVDNARNPYTEKSGYDHGPNMTTTRQYAISQGIWPTGDVRHVSTKRHPDGASWVLTYAVEGVPAHDAAGESPHPEVAGQADVTDGEVAEPGAPVNAESSAPEEPTA